MEELQGWGGEFNFVEAFFTQIKIWLLATNITPTHFGEQMALHHNQLTPNGHVEGSTQSLEMKWNLIKHDISKFVGVYGNIASLNEWRSSTKYILHHAFQLYKLKHLQGLGFCFLHCWFLSKGCVQVKGFVWKFAKSNMHDLTTNPINTT